jgi:hypothetical protein
MIKLSLPGLLLRIEGTVVFLAALLLYSNLQFAWLTLILLFLTPDLSMLAYLVNPRLGSQAYNLVHTYVLPISVTILALLFNWTLGIQIALIWMAHIGLDRLFGYGLKYPDAFKHTHLGQV